MPLAHGRRMRRSFRGTVQFRETHMERPSDKKGGDREKPNVSGKHDAALS
jgi:hypothetical protein